MDDPARRRPVCPLCLLPVRLGDDWVEAIDWQPIRFTHVACLTRKDKT
jgi:hypothetical protein